MKKAIYISAAAIVVFCAVYLFIFPDVSRFRKENPKRTSLMEYRLGQWKKAGKKMSIFQVWAPFSKISPYLVKAVIIAEDDKFWTHEGFDYEAIGEAIEKNIKAGRFRAGGSTISQQLAKNLFLTPEKTVFRKLKEAALTWRLERALTKRRILEIYLNVVEWGDGVFGVEAASRRYFGKTALDLGPMEAARLVSTLPSPIRFNPTGEQRFVLSRSAVIYNIMVKRGIVLPEYEEIRNTPAEEAALALEPPSAAADAKPSEEQGLPAGPPAQSIVEEPAPGKPAKAGGR
ncbi:MAG: monofunctional biosynthetic peptidoglycan transglycosylase [Deltaproteobacteria bacterium]|nr:monofunctional biosynthetic peptidoglycan transglycosylase [Deltaproteobacteria bacterium]